MTRIVAFCVLLAVPSLAGAQGANAQVDRDMAEIRAYRLSMPKLQQLRNMYAALAESLKTDPAYLALKRLQDEKQALEKKDERTETEEERLASLGEEIEKAEDRLSPSQGEQKTLADMTRAIESNPKMLAAVRSAGLTPRETATMQLALLEAMFAHGFQKSGAIKELPAGVSQENVEFIRQHEKDIEALMSDVKKAEK